jgi:hypothetical protein
MSTNELSPEQKATMRQTWGQSGTPYANLNAFKRMLADRERLARIAEQNGKREIAQKIRQETEAMRTYARELSGLR